MSCCAVQCAVLIVLCDRLPVLFSLVARLCPSAVSVHGGRVDESFHAASAKTRRAGLIGQPVRLLAATVAVSLAPATVSVRAPAVAFRSSPRPLRTLHPLPSSSLALHSSSLLCFYLCHRHLPLHTLSSSRLRCSAISMSAAGCISFFSRCRFPSLSPSPHASKHKSANFLFKSCHALCREANLERARQSPAEAMLAAVASSSRARATLVLLRCRRLAAIFVTSLPVSGLSRRAHTSDQSRVIS